MPDLARNVRTDEICSAAELNVREDIQDDAFTCIGCTAEMRPIAVQPGAHYRVVPHFRVHGRHDADCDGDGRPVAATRVRRLDGQVPRNRPALLPTRLRLVDERPQVEPREAQDPGADPPQAAGKAGGEAAEGRHDQVAGTLHRIVQCYLRLPEPRGLQLSLPGCSGTTYQECFERLKAEARRKYGRKVYFDAVSFEKYDVDDAMTELDVLLGPSVYGLDAKRRTVVAERFRVRFDMHAWSDRRRLGFLKDLRRAKERQIGMRQENAALRILLFFLGTQDPKDGTLFHVDDGRLACFNLGPAAPPGARARAAAGRDVVRPR